MKKVLVLLLAAVMMMSFTACSADNVTVMQKSERTDAEKNTYFSKVEAYGGYAAESEIDSILADAVPVVLNTSNEYEEIIKGLGFAEIDLDLHCVMNPDGTPGNPTAAPKSLTYKDGYFRLELSYYDAETKEVTDGWVLYGTKAAEIADISGFDPKACDYYDIFDYSEAFPEYNEYNAQYVDYTYLFGENGCAIAKAEFFNETGNLYNLVNVFEEFPENGLCPPYVIWREDQMNN